MEISGEETTLRDMGTEIMALNRICMRVWTLYQLYIFACSDGLSLCVA